MLFGTGEVPQQNQVRQLPLQCNHCGGAGWTVVCLECHFELHWRWDSCGGVDAPVYRYSEIIMNEGRASTRQSQWLLPCAIALKSRHSFTWQEMAVAHRSAGPEPPNPNPHGVVQSGIGLPWSTQFSRRSKQVDPLRGPRRGVMSIVFHVL